MRLIAIDTSTSRLAVAALDGDRSLAAVADDDGRRTVELLMATIMATVAEAGWMLADVDGIVVGIGPGPYTALRVGIVTASALGDALDVPVVGVCSLDAYGALGTTVVADARRREVYWARYDQDGRRVDGPGVCPPAEAPAGPYVGAGCALYPEVLPGTAQGVDAALLGRLGAQRLDAGENDRCPQPLYLRQPDAVAPGPAKPVL